MQGRFRNEAHAPGASASSSAPTCTGHPRQRTKTVEAKNQTEARAALRAWEKELDDQQGPTNSTATVRSLVEEWLRHSDARGRAPRTLHDTRRSAETIVFPEFGEVPIADLTPRHLDEWYRKLATGEGRDRPLKPTSIRRHHAVLSAARSQAVRWSWLDRNPARGPGRLRWATSSRRFRPSKRCRHSWPKGPSATSAGGCSCPWPS